MCAGSSPAPVAYISLVSGGSTTTTRTSATSLVGQCDDLGIGTVSISTTQPLDEDVERENDSAHSPPKLNSARGGQQGHPQRMADEECPMEQAPTTPVGGSKRPRGDEKGAQSPSKTTKTATDSAGPSTADMMAFMKMQSDRNERNTKEMILHLAQRAEATDSKIASLETRFDEATGRLDRLEGDLSAEVKKMRISFDAVKRDAEVKAKKLQELQNRIHESATSSSSAPGPPTTRSNEDMATAIIGGLGKDLPTQVLISKFNQFARPVPTDEMASGSIAEAPFLTGSSVQFKASSTSVARSVASAVRSASIVVKQNNQEYKVYATMLKTEDRKDRMRRLMKLGDKPQTYFSEPHCETYATVCWRSSEIVNNGKRVCKLARDNESLQWHSDWHGGWWLAHNQGSCGQPHQDRHRGQSATVTVAAAEDLGHDVQA